jgi:D-aminoacyl-tRNA deacylase
MAVIIVCSTKDPASINIQKRLFEQTKWNEIDIFNGLPIFSHATMNDVIMLTITDRKIRHEHLDTEIKNDLGIEPTLVLFISRHTSKMKKPTLTVHPIGNYRDAQFGGRPNTLVPPSPKMMTHLLRLIKKNLQLTNLQYHVCYEVTHHGPYLDVPTLFAEVGSTEEEWIKKEPATIIAHSILELLTKYHCEADFSHTIPILVGIGGGHYAPRFTDVVFEKNVAFGHMIPSYHIESDKMPVELFNSALSSTKEVTAIYLDKKALKKSQVTAFKQWFHDKELPVISSNDLPTLT